jgi:hypothetical protein
MPNGQITAFDVQVEFASPRSFHVYIAVFATHREAVDYRTAGVASRETGVARCEKIPSCRTTLKGSSHEAMFGIERIIGPVFYSASPDKRTGTIPAAPLAQFLASISGPTHT